MGNETEQSTTFIHPSAIVDKGAQIGEGAQIWHFTHITSCATVGADTIIGQGCFIDGQIGSGVRVANNVSIYCGVEIGDFSFIGNGTTFGNVTIPRSFRKIERDNYKKTIVGKGVTIEHNATIMPGCRIGHDAIIGMGTVVTEDIPPKVMVTGNPARIAIKSLKRTANL